MLASRTQAPPRSAARPRRAATLAHIAVAGLLLGCGDQPLSRVLADQPSPPPTTRPSIANGGDDGATPSAAAAFGVREAAGVADPVLSPAHTVTPRGIGGWVVGTAVARSSAGALDARCEHTAPAGAPAGVRAVVVDGVLARLDVEQPGVATPQGVEVGGPAARVVGAYRGQFTRQRQFGSETFVITPPAAVDRALRLVVETDGRTVSRIRVGRLPEVLTPAPCGTAGG